MLTFRGRSFSTNFSTELLKSSEPEDRGPRVRIRMDLPSGVGNRRRRRTLSEEKRRSGRLSRLRAASTASAVAGPLEVWEPVERRAGGWGVGQEGPAGPVPGLPAVW